MRGALRQTGLTCFLLSMPVAANAQSPQDHIPLIQLPVIAPDSYPRRGTLTDIRQWVYKEFARIATERNEGPLPAPPSRYGGSCRTICVVPTAEALPITEWNALARRVTTELSSSDVESRRAAINMAQTLQQISCFGDPPLRSLFSNELLTALAERVRDPDPKIRGYAARLFAGNAGKLVRGQYEPHPGFDPVPILLAAINDPDPGARRQIVQALQGIGGGYGTTGSNRYGPHADAVVPALIGLADDPDKMTRLVAIHAIGYAGQSAVPAIPRLIEWLESPDGMKRRGAAWALAELGPLAAPAVPALAAMLRSKDAADRHRALNSLRRMGNIAAPAVPAIAELLKDDDLATTSSAAWTLEHIGPAAKAVLPHLRELAARSDEQYRRETNRAIAIIEGRRALDDFPPRLSIPE